MQAFFLATDDESTGRRFCLHHAPATGSARGLIVHVHAFAEEMNKARRMAALQARALGAAGFAVLQMDLRGCGDSAGDFADASWAGWLDDIEAAARWLRQRHDGPLWFWGVRAGCLLAVHAAARLGTPCNFLFWQSATSGKTVLQQFLRLKVAAALQDGGGKGLIEGLRDRLARGEAVDIAGYRLPSAVAQPLADATLAPPAETGRLVWLEVSTRPDATLGPAAQQALACWSEAGFATVANTVVGPQFWQTTEIEDAPALIDATLQALAA
jgi:exosortase A-associated hydrolase 2